MARLTWLPDVLRAAGLTVDVLPGWSQRGRADFNPQGLVCHHTVTGPSWPVHRVDHLLRDGHANLAGPLSQLGLRRDGSFVIVAAGRANHNGFGRWGNDSIGIEAYNDGVREPWPAVQMDAYARGCAAILAHQGWGIDRCLGHKETDPKRKTDPTFDMAAFRRRVAERLAAPPTPQEDDLMATDPRGVARLTMREFLGRSPESYAELDEHADRIKADGLNAHIEWLEATPEGLAWAKRIGAEVRTPDRD